MENGLYVRCILLVKEKKPGKDLRHQQKKFTFVKFQLVILNNDMGLTY